jgi:hypothetical protein
VNLTSLNLIKGELFVAMQQSSSNIESFISNRDNAEFLQVSLEVLKQILGVMRMLQLRGADVLVAEMVEALSAIPIGADASHDKALSAISTGFFILPRYFEYSQQTEQCTPVLLLSFINDIRQARGKPLLLEGSFFAVHVSAQRPRNSRALPMPSTSEFASLVRRLRQMYQVGLLGVLQNRSVKPSLAMMGRAMARLDRYCSDTAMGKLWWLMAVTMQAMEAQGMVVTPPRKFVFSAVDRQLRQLHKNGVVFLEQQPNEELLRDLLYLIAISGAQLSSVKEVRLAFGIAAIPFTDAQLVQELDNLRGPEMGTIHSVVEVIREEIRTAKNSLEIISMGGTDAAESYQLLADSLQRVADILSVVGLATVSTSLREQIALFRQWITQNHVADKQELLKAADALLYVESTMSNLQKINLSPEMLAKANALAKDEVIARSQIADAEKVVLEEAQAGLALIKRSIMSFQESNYDRNHIANLGKSLNSVRGALIMMNMARAANISNSCIRFVDEVLLKGELSGAIQQILETFADAIISLEYYLENYIQVGVKDETVLDLAVESVQALGVPIEK